MLSWTVSESTTVTALLCLVQAATKDPPYQDYEAPLEGDIAAVATPSEEKEFNTLDEPVLTTITRDLKAIGIKFAHVLYPKQKNTILRDWDLWGPLILCVFLAMMLQQPDDEKNTQGRSSVCPDIRLGVARCRHRHIELQTFGRNDIILPECVRAGLLLAGTLCCINHMQNHSASWEPDCWTVHPPLLCDHAWLWLGCICINGIPCRQPAVIKESTGGVSHLSFLFRDQLADTGALTLGSCGTSRRHIFLCPSS
ncbi:hypothetical protein MRX96_041355 [Rhipicephalus microplus]